MRTIKRVLALFFFAAFGCSSLGTTRSEPTYDAFAGQAVSGPGFRVCGWFGGACTGRGLDIAMMVWMLRGGNRTVGIDAGYQRADLIQRWRATGYVKPSEDVASAGVAPE